MLDAPRSREEAQKRTYGGFYGERQWANRVRYTPAQCAYACYKSTWFTKQCVRAPVAGSIHCKQHAKILKVREG